MIQFFAYHLYFLAALYSIFLWVLFFSLVKENRRQILIVSIIGMIMGALSQMYLVDWWHPNFIFNSFIKIEDLIFGFGIAGSISAIFLIFSNQARKNIIQQITIRTKIAITFASLGLMFFIFYILKISSLWSTIFAMILPVFYIYLKYPKIILPSLYTGLLVNILFLPGYLLGIYLNPNWIQNEWLIHKLSGLTILAVPIEEFIWYLIASLGISVFIILWGNNKRKINYK